MENCDQLLLSQAANLTAEIVLEKASPLMALGRCNFLETTVQKIKNRREKAQYQICPFTFHFVFLHGRHHLILKLHSYRTCECRQYLFYLIDCKRSSEYPDPSPANEVIPKTQELLHDYVDIDQPLEKNSNSPAAPEEIKTFSKREAPSPPQQKKNSSNTSENKAIARTVSDSVVSERASMDLLVKTKSLEIAGPPAQSNPRFKEAPNHVKMARTSSRADDEQGRYFCLQLRLKIIQRRGQSKYSSAFKAPKFRFYRGRTTGTYPQDRTGTKQSRD